MDQRSVIRPTEVRVDNKNIKPTQVSANRPVVFNFKNLTDKTSKFNYKAKDKKYFLKLLERLVAVSCMDRDTMTVANRDALRCHKINFEEERVSESTFNLGQGCDENAWQFQISSNKHGRIHGYFVDNIFFVVWLDPDHELYFT